MFAFATYDARDRSLLLARDRYGEKPLFLLHQRDSVCFASEIASLEALALGPAFHFEMALSIACAVMREAQDAESLWPSLPWLGGVSLGKAPNRDEARLFGCQCQPKRFQSLCQQLVDAERIASVLKAEDKIVQRANPVGFALSWFSYLLFNP